MTSPTTQFDQIRLEAGDTLLAFRCVRGALTGEGSYRHPNSRSLPPKPDLDALLWGQSEQLGPEVRCAVPAFHFSSH